MIWLLGCAGDDAPDALAVEATVSVPSSAAPLVRALHVEASAPVTVRARWDGAEVTFPAGGTAQDHLLLGFRPGQAHAVEVEVEDAAGNTASATVEVVTDPLPAHFPRARVTGAQGEPGHTLVSMRSDRGPAPSEVAAVYDEAGEVRWTLEVEDVLQDVREVEGELWVLAGSDRAWLARYGWDGIERQRWALGAGQVEARHARVLHHDAGVVPGLDRIVALGRAPLQVAAYPADYDDPEITEARVVSDDVVVVFGTDGAVEREYRLSERWPMRRIGYDSLSTTIDGGADWAHANAILWDDGEVLLSLRHQDALVKLDAAGEVRWILANDANWPPDLAARRLTPVGELAWPYHQHGPWLGPVDADGERVLLVYDNGNHQASPWTGEERVTDPRSRVVQYRIDEAARTVRQDWVFDEPGGGALFSGAVGDVDLLPGGTVLSTWGFLDRLPDGQSNEALGLGRRSARILELDPTDPGDVRQIWELYLSNDAVDNAMGWTVYRAQRIPSLDPGGSVLRGR